MGMPPQGPPAKKSNVLMWVLIGVGGIVVLGMLAVGIGSFVIYRTVSHVVKESGFDPDLMQRNPGLAMAKMVAAINPDAEVVSTNDRSGTITIKEKSTGKVVTMRFDPDKKSLVIVGDDGSNVSIKADGDGNNGSVEINGGDGSIKFGGAATGSAMPSWLPAYPGSSPQGTFSSQNKDGSQNSWGFKTSDAPGAVITFYQDKLKAAGMTINMTTNTGGGGMIMAADEAAKRTVMVTANVGGADGTSGTITVVQK